jgi:hypothetical protein
MKTAELDKRHGLLGSNLKTERRVFKTVDALGDNRPSENEWLAEFNNLSARCHQHDERRVE